MDDATHDSAQTTPDKPKSATAPASRTKVTVLGGVLGLITALALTVLGVSAYTLWRSLPSGPRLAEIDRASFDAARAKWKASGPASYDIQIAVEGLQRAVYRVQVRDGKAVSATRNDAPLTDPRTIGTWSVPGMFDTIASDVEHSEEPIEISARESHYVSPRALFDEQYGYPARYRRIEWGSNVEASWTVTEFRFVDE